MPALEIENFSVSYGGVVAVRRIELAVRSSEIFVLLGANGAGKSSTLRGIMGLVRRTGSVVWDGQSISTWRPSRIARSGLVLVPEGRRIFSPLTVEENLMMGAYAQKSRERQRSSLERVYSMFPILHQRRTGSGGLLSGGEQQMLAFGRALMANPRMILMDEPSMGLSPAMVDLVMESVAEIASTGISILMVEQNAAVALQIAHRGAVLDRGEVLIRDSADSLRNDPRVLRAFLGDRAYKEEVAPRVVEKPA